MSKASDDGNPLKENLEAWLAREGYPLELSVANAFHAAGFEVLHRQYFRNKSQQSSGATDIAVRTSVDVGNSLLRLYYLIECKWSKDKPWVIFLGDAKTPPASLVAQTVASQTARALFWARAGDPALQALSLFKPPAQFGFAGRQAFDDKSDVFDTTVQSLLTRALRLVASYDGACREPKDLLQTAVAVFPIIVVDGPLYTASLGAEADKLALTQASHVRVFWRASAVWPLHATVDIVTAFDLPGFGAQRCSDATALMQQLTEPMKQLQRCWAEKSLAPLEITAGSKGTIGLPHLLREMQARFPRRKQLPPSPSTSSQEEASPAEAGLDKILWKPWTGRAQRDSRATLQ